MTFTEVVVSALILGISSQVSLQGWSRTSQAAATSARADQHVQLLEQRLLASRLALAFHPSLLSTAVGIVRRWSGFWRACPKTPASKRHGDSNLQRMASGSSSS